MSEIIERIAKWATWLGNAVLLYAVNVLGILATSTPAGSSSIVPAGSVGGSEDSLALTLFSVGSLALTTCAAVFIPIWRAWRTDKRESHLAQAALAASRAERAAAEAQAALARAQLKIATESAPND